MIDCQNMLNIGISSLFANRAYTQTSHWNSLYSSCEIINTRIRSCVSATVGPSAATWCALVRDDLRLCVRNTTHRFSPSASVCLHRIAQIHYCADSVDNKYRAKTFFYCGAHQRVYQHPTATLLCGVRCSCDEIHSLNAHDNHSCHRMTHHTW